MQRFMPPSEQGSSVRGEAQTYFRTDLIIDSVHTSFSYPPLLEASDPFYRWSYFVDN